MPNLFVFLHGVTVISPRGDGLRIILPTIPGHVQKAGTWLWETAIAPGAVLRLKGVAMGQRTIAATDRIIYLPAVTVTQRHRAATIYLPKPDDILFLLCATDPFERTLATQAPATAYVARTKDPTPQNFPTLSAVQVLIYRFSDENDVVLEGHRWEPVRTGDSVTLHVVSTSEDAEGKEHEDETDDVMREVLDGYSGLDHKLPRRPGAPWYDPQHPNYGDLHGLVSHGEHFLSPNGNLAFAKAELEHPTSRALRLARLGRLKQAGRPIDSLWNDPDFLGDRPCNCSTFGTP